MLSTRHRIELILRARYYEANVSPPAISPETIERVADSLRARCGHGPFVLPYALGVAADVVVEEGAVPEGMEMLVEERRVVLRRQIDARSCALLALQGLARCMLRLAVGPHNAPDVVALMGELTVPSRFVLRRHRSALFCRPDLPDWFVAAWCDAVLGSPSSKRAA